MKRSVPWASLEYITRHGTPTHTHVLMTLVRCTSPVTGKIKVTLDELAEAANLSRKTIQRSISWLEEHQIVVSKRLSGYSGKMYVIHPRVVTHDHPDWSPVTTLMPADLGLCDPPASVVPLLHESSGNGSKDSRGTTSLYYTPSVYKVNKAEDDTFSPVILGADPDTPPEPAKRSRRDKKPPAPSVDLLQYWNFIARRYGVRPLVAHTDCRIFQRHVNRLLAAGLTPFAMKSMISDFFQLDRNREHRTPHFVFFSAEVQRSLVPMTRAVAVSDPVLGWMASGFTDTGTLPWSEEFCGAFQNVALRRGLSLMYRYPEVLASIALVADGDIERAKELITEASALLAARLSGAAEECRQHSAILNDNGVILPPDLATGRRSLREEAASLQEAILASCADASA